MEGGYADPTLPQKEEDPWCFIDPKARTVSIAGETFHINHRPTPMILAELLKGSEDKPVLSRNLQNIPGCGHARQVQRFLTDHLPPQIKKIIRQKPGASGGRWLVPPWQS